MWRFILFVSATWPRRHKTTDRRGIVVRQFRSRLLPFLPQAEIIGTKGFQLQSGAAFITFFFFFCICSRSNRKVSQCFGVMFLLHFHALRQTAAKQLEALPELAVVWQLPEQKTERGREGKKKKIKSLITYSWNSPLESSRCGYWSVWNYPDRDVKIPFDWPSDVSSFAINVRNGQTNKVARQSLHDQAEWITIMHLILDLKLLRFENVPVNVLCWRSWDFARSSSTLC